MAELLKRQYDLTVLKVTLLPGSSSARRSAPSPTESTARVQFVLQHREGPEVVDSQPIEAPAHALGIPRYLDWKMLQGRGGYDFRLPPAVTSWLEDQLWEVELSGRPLWLHLVKPYGYLGMFPWERLLRGIAPSGVLRLPDFVVDPPQQTPSAIDVALCCRLGPQDDLKAAAEILRSMAGALTRSGGTRPARVAVLVDEAVHDCLADERAPENVSFHLLGSGEESRLDTVLAALAAAPGAVLNPIREWLRRRNNLGPASRSTSTEDLLGAAVDPISSPWLRAIRTALGGRSVDAIHLVSNAMLSLERGVLMADPVDDREKIVSPHVISATEFLALQSQVGAWIVGVTSLPGSYSDMALRQFADDLGQLRPGPLLYHDAVEDPGCDGLGAAYAFLLSPRPTRPPRADGAFVYCEPFRVRDDRRGETTLEAESSRLSPATRQPNAHAGITSIFEGIDNVPSWVAASERFVDRYKLRLAELSSKVEEAPGLRLDEIRSTLTRLQNVVAKVAKDQIR